MPLDANILLAGKPAQIDTPFQTIGQLMSIRDTASQVALRQAQTENMQAEATQRNRDIADQNKLQELMKDPTNMAAIGSGDFSSVYGQVQPKTALALRQAHLDALKTTLANTAAQNKERADALGEVRDSAAGLLTPDENGKPPSIDVINSRLAGASQYLTSNGVLKRAGIGSLPPSVNSPDQINQFIAGIGGEVALHERALKDQETQATTEQKKAGAQKDISEAGKSDLEQQLIKHQLDLYNTLKANPQSLGQRVAASIDPQKYPQEYARALNEAQNAPDLKGINEAIAKHSQLVSEREKTIATETDPSVMRARTQQKINEETALTPLRTAAAINLEKAKAAMAPGAVAGITDPVLQRNVISKWEAAQNEYQTKEGESARLLGYINAARSDNQAAGALAPIAEARSIVNRINTQEINAGSGAVSAARRVETWLSKGITGTPPRDVLNDMEEIGKINQEAAKTTWRGKVRTVNALGAKFPTDEPISGLPDKPAHAGTSAPPLPSKLSASHVGKPFTNKAGKVITVTAVNPSDPTQFTFK